MLHHRETRCLDSLPSEQKCGKLTYRTSSRGSKHSNSYPNIIYRCLFALPDFCLGVSN